MTEADEVERYYARELERLKREHAKVVAQLDEQRRVNDDLSRLKSIALRCPHDGCDRPMHIAGAEQTLIGHFDPEGHRHNPNRVTIKYACPGGHSMVIVGYEVCPAPGCEWKQQRVYPKV